VQPSGPLIVALASENLAAVDAKRVNVRRRRRAIDTWSTQMGRTLVLDQVRPSMTALSYVNISTVHFVVGLVRRNIDALSHALIMRLREISALGFLVSKR
jgi:hypothetical protein